MDWNQSKVGYYADFALVPLLILAALIFRHGGIASFAALAVVGLALWTFIEYWLHRALFHRVLRRAHWLHHRKARAYVAAPVWLTTIAHLAVAGLALATHTLGLFAGIEAGYFAYIVMHDRMHHSTKRPTGWFEKRWQLHMMHHNGAEKNFGVITSFWDHAFITYWGPEWVPSHGVDARSRRVNGGVDNGRRNV